MSGSVVASEALIFSNEVIRSVVDEAVIQGERVIRIHTAWQLRNGSILLYEYSSRNQPSSSITVHDNLQEYHEICEQIHWLK